MELETRASLLERLRDGADAVGWQEFFDRYWRAIHGFARWRGCSDQTAQDVVQDAMLVVFENRGAFRYDPSRGRFRNWLFTVVHRLILRRRERAGRLAVSLDASDGAPEPPAEGPPPDAAWESAFDGAVLLALLDVVRQEVSPETYQAFELSLLHEVPGAEVARLTGLSRNAVYLSCRRVLKRLRELGAPYQEGKPLNDRVKEALSLYTAPPVERSVTTYIEQTMSSR